MNIILTGFMATGKTKISRCIADVLGYEWADTDEMIVAEAGLSINEIFKTYGEEYFRRLEHEIVKRIGGCDKTVISTGGGVVLNPENISVLRKNGIVINLAPDFGVIAERISEAAETRPLMKGQSIADIEKRFNDRKPFYDNCDYKIKVTNEKSPEEHARKIINLLRENNIHI